MAVETEPTTPVETTPTTPVESQVTEPVAPETPVEATPTEPAPEPDKPKQTPWFQKRIDDLTAEKYSLRQQVADFQKQLDAFTALTKPEPAVVTAPPVADIDKQVEERATQLARVREFNEQCNSVYTKGEKAFGEKFQGAVANLNAAGVISQENMSFLEAAMATEAPEQVIYKLGSEDPTEAMRLATLTPTRLAIELDRIARDLGKPAPVSNVPPPITPVDGRRTTPAFDEADTKTDLRTWLAEREKQVAARRANRV